jgi:16S rRNA (guanine527-N7)-methyltransferase
MGDRLSALRLTPVSRETESMIAQLVDEALRWNAVKNLVGPTFASDPWGRHVADSLQLLRFADGPGDWLDIGSGGGFPGLVIACARTTAGSGKTWLLEANSRKCGFLRHMVALLRLDADVIEGRIEASLPKQARYVSARAVASLGQLVEWTTPLLRTGALGIFPKGQEVDTEIAEAVRTADVSIDLAPSLTDAAARIVLLRMTGEELNPDVHHVDV